MAATDLTVTAALAYDDNQVARATRRMASIVNKTASTSLGSFGGAQFKEFQQSIDAATARVTAFGLTAGIFFTVKRSLIELARATVDVEKELTNVNLILGLSGRSLRMFSDDLFNIAKNTGQSFDKVTKAATEFSRQGLGVEETLKRTRDALILSRLAGIDTMKSVEDLTATINSFSDSILDSTQLVSKFVAVDQRFAVSSADLAEAIKRVGSTAQDAGIDIDELVGLVTALQERTARGGAVIGNALKTIFTRVQGANVLDQLQAFDIQVRDLNNNLLPTLSILDNIADAFKRLEQAEQIRLTEKIGGVYQINQLRSLLRDLRGGRSTAAEAAGISAGASTEALIKNEQFNLTLAAQLNRTIENIRSTLSKVGEMGLSQNLKSTLDVFNEFLESITQAKGIESMGATIAKGLFKGVFDYIFGVGGVTLILILYKIGREAIGKVFLALGSFTRGAEILRAQLGTLEQQSSAIGRITGANTGRLSVEKEILGVIQAQNVAKLAMPNVSGFGGVSGPLTGFGRGRSLGPSAIMPGTVPIPSLRTLERRGVAKSIDSLESQLSYLTSRKAFVEMPIKERLRETGNVQTLLSQYRERLKSIDQGTELRESLLKSTRMEKENLIISGPAFRRQQEAAAIANRIREEQSGVNLRNVMQTELEKLKARDVQDVAQQQARIDSLKRRDALIGPAGGIFMGGRARGQLQQLDPEAFAEVQQRRMGRLFLGSFLAPMAGNVLGELGFSGETRGQRIGRSVSAGLGNMVGGAMMGGAWTGGTPAGFITGGVLAALGSMLIIFREMNTVLPELNANLQQSKDNLARAEENLMTAYQLGEMAEGFTSGRIKTSPSNKLGFERRVMEFIGRTSGKVPVGNQQEMLSDILSGDPDKIKKWEDVLRPPVLASDVSFRQFATGFGTAKEQEDIGGLVDMFFSLRSRTGEPMANILQSSQAQKWLSRIRLPKTEYFPNEYGMMEPQMIPGNYKSLTTLLGLFATPQATEDFGEALSRSPLTPSFIQGIMNRRTFGGAGQLQKFFGRSAQPSARTNRMFESLFQPQMLSTLGVANAGFMGILGGGINRSTSQMNIISAQNEAAIALAAMNQSPLQIEQMRGRFGQTDIMRGAGIAGRKLDLETGGGLLGTLTQMRSRLGSVQWDRFSQTFSVLEATARDIASGKPGSMQSFSDILKQFSNSIKNNTDLVPALSSSIGELQISLLNYSNKLGELTLTTEEQLKILEIQNNLAKELASPEGRARLSAQAFETSAIDEAARVKEFTNQGLLFSDQRAQAQLNADIGLIATGKLKGGAISKAMIGGFSNQFEFGIKDMYRELRQGANDVGLALKSSFSDAFKTFLDGSQSASDALRSLGLSFANKLLDIAAMGTTNLLFGGLQNLGSFMFSGMKKGATGGYVTGGSGIRDDIPMTLNQGDYVLRKSAVSKYGTGFLNAMNFANGGGVNYTPASPLSNFALSDENNPQNRLRMERESEELNALMQYQNALAAYNAAKKQRRLGAFINLGVALAGAGLTQAFYRPTGKVTVGPMERVFHPYTGGLMTSSGIQRFARGGSVDSVPALLTGGEFVMNRNAVSRFGVGFMHRLNRGEVPAFNTGGFVGEAIEGGGSGRDEGLNNSISRLINSQEKLRTTLEKGGGRESEGMITSPLVGSISINVAMGNDGNVKADVQTEGPNKEENRANKGAELAELIKATVVETIVKQSRNGGLLEQNFQRRRTS